MTCALVSAPGSVAGSLTLIAVRRRGPAVSEGGAVHEHEQVGITAAVLAVLSLVVPSAFTTRSGFTGTIYFGMDAPLTGATQLVGQSDRDAVQSIVAYWNAQGGIKGKEVVVDVLDNASNPSQAVQNVQRFIGDSKYVGILGSGNAAAAVATGPLASQAGIPFIALSPPTNLIEPPQPYVYVLTATSRLYAYNEAAYLRKLGIKKVWLMGDNGGLRPGRPHAGAEAREQVRAPDPRHDDLLPGVDGLLGRADQGERLRRGGPLALDRDTRGCPRSSSSSSSSSCRSSSS